METLNKEQFIQQYVLNRALTIDYIMDGSGAVLEANNAYNKIINLLIEDRGN